MSINTKEQAYSKAKALAAYLATQGCNIGHRKALDALAVTEGLKNWNVLSARLNLEKVSNEVPAKPSAAGLSIARLQDASLQWEAELVRLSLGYENFEVSASSLSEALDEVLEQACNTYFSERSSQWYLSSVRSNGEHREVPPDFEAPEYAQPDNTRFEGINCPQRFEIQVTRVGIGFGTAEYNTSAADANIFEILRDQGDSIGVSESCSEYHCEVLSATPM